MWETYDIFPIKTAVFPPPKHVTKYKIIFWKHLVPEFKSVQNVYVISSNLDECKLHHQKRCTLLCCLSELMNNG